MTRYASLWVGTILFLVRLQPSRDVESRLIEYLDKLPHVKDLVKPLFHRIGSDRLQFILQQPSHIPARRCCSEHNNDATRPFEGFLANQPAIKN